MKLRLIVCLSIRVMSVERIKKTLIDTISDLSPDPIDHSSPTCYAVKLDRLPSVDVEHIDLSSLLREVSSLRAEVRAVTTIRSDVSEIRSSLKRQAATVQTPTTTALSHSSLPSSASIASNVLMLVNRSL